MKKFIPLLALFTAVLSASTAHAVCSTPTANAGAILYNTGQNTVQFCNGDDWYNTGLVVASATGTTCTTPTGPEGSMFYNTGQNTVQFCNGDNWVNMGTMRFPSATGTSCTTPTGPEGSMFFNTTTKTMQFCNGDNWVNATYLTVAADAITGVELTKIQASDREENDVFGRSVSINGDYAIVGAHGEDTGGSAAGAAYIFKNTSGTWAQQTKIQSSDKEAGDSFGRSVSISGDYAIVGASTEDTGGSNAGSAYIFKRTGTTWAQEAKIQSSDIEGDDRFGFSVFIDANYAIVGASFESTSAFKAGAAYIFKRSGSVWTQEAKIMASDAQADDYFGRTVSIDGDYVITGAYAEDTGGSYAGAAYIFKRTGTTWAQEAKIMASDAQADDRFGSSVSINGDYAVVGAFYEDTGGSNAGAAYIFKRSGSTWTQEAKIMASDAEASDSFGYSVSVNSDYAVIGAYYEDTGGVNAGAAYIFKRTGTSWVEQSKIQASDEEADNYFGIAVAIDNGRVIVGAEHEDTGGANAGAAYIFD